MLKARSVVAVTALAFLAALAGEAAASPLFELAGGVTGLGGFNARTVSAGSSSTYFNPALLPQAEQTLELGVMVLSDQISMTLDGRPGGNVPLVVGDRQIVYPNGDPISNATVPTDWLQHGCSVSQCGEPAFAPRPRQAAGTSGNTRAYAIVGLVSHVLDDTLVLAVQGLIPADQFTTAQSFFNDERAQFFSNSLHPELYGDRLTATSLSFGAGSRLFDELSIGASFTLSLTNTAKASTYVRDPVDYDKIILSTDVAVDANVSPHFGIVYEPIDALDLTATLHSQQEFVIDTAVGATLPAGNESVTTRRAVHAFLPWTFGLGGALTTLKGPLYELRVVSTLEYALWSDYIDRHADHPGAEGKQFGWSNVVSGSVGARFSYGMARTMLDLTYYPSPVPPQTGRRNYVDNDRVGLALGADYQFTFLGLRWRPGLQLTGYRLVPRYQRKNDALLVDELPDDAVDARTGAPIPGAQGLQTNNPGWPGFASEGWIFGGSFTVALLY